MAQLLFQLILLIAIISINVGYPHPGVTTKFEHYGDYKHLKNDCYKRRCPQLSPNYKGEHTWPDDLKVFQKDSFFACDHQYNKCHSVPSDYDIVGNYSSGGLNCHTLEKKTKRDQTNFDGLRKAGKTCQEDAEKKCNGTAGVKKSFYL